MKNRLRVSHLAVATAVLLFVASASIQTVRASAATTGCQWNQDIEACEDTTGTCTSQRGICIDPQHIGWCCCDYGWGC